MGYLPLLKNDVPECRTGVDFWDSKKIPSELAVRTSWGAYGLVRAMLKLLRT
jgi:hypothetical protein